MSSTDLLSLIAFAVAVVLTAVVVVLFISGRLAAAIEAFSQDGGAPRSRRKEERASRFVHFALSRLDWLADRPFVQGVVRSRFYKPWISQALSVCMCGLLILMALAGKSHWIFGAFGAALLALNLVFWKLWKMAEKG